MDVCRDKQKTTVITDEQAEANLPEILDKMGIQACKTKSGTVKTFGASASYHSSIGCEKITAISKKYLEAKSMLNCVVTDITNNAETRVDVVQRIEVYNKGLIDCTCTGPQCGQSQGLVISQSSAAKVIAKNQMASKLNDEIGSELTELANVVFGTIKTPGKDPAEYLKDSDAQKKIVAVSEALDTKMTNIGWTKVVNDAITSASVSQVIKVVNYGTIKGDGCNFSQEAVTSAVSNTIMSFGLEKALVESGVREYIEDMNAHDAVTYPIPPPVVFKWDSTLLIFLYILIGVTIVVMAGMAWKRFVNS
jgi:CheY-specific phosphatase CheX